MPCLMYHIREVQTWNGAHFDVEKWIDVSVAGDIVSCCTHMHKLCNLYLNVTRNSHFGGLAVKLINGRKYNDALK